MKIGTALNYYFSGIFVYLKDNIFVNWLFWAGTVGNVTLIKIILESQKIINNKYWPSGDEHESTLLYMTSVPNYCNKTFHFMNISTIMFPIIKWIFLRMCLCMYSQSSSAQSNLDQPTLAGMHPSLLSYLG